MLLFSLHNTLGNADGTRGANEAAEVTADALGSNDAGLADVRVERDSLMTTIHAGHVATSAPDAHVAVNLRIDDGIAIQAVGVQELRQLLTHQLLQLRDAALGHVALKPEDEVVDNAVAILHDGGTHLYVAAT